MLPPYWEECTHTVPSSGRIYKTYKGPDGQVCRSRVQAWREHEAHRGRRDSPESDDSEHDQDAVVYARRAEQSTRSGRRSSPPRGGDFMSENALLSLLEAASPSSLPPAPSP